MPLSIYRRHSVDCRVHKLKLSTSQKRFFTDCECPIWLTGTTDSEKYPRQALGVRDWAAAEAKLRSLDAEASHAVLSNWWERCWEHPPSTEHANLTFLAATGANLGVKSRRYPMPAAM